MLRATLVGNADVDGHGFRIRSREVSRLEGLSDAVFGFAITLLVVSLEVPATFDELVAMMRGFVAFAASFAVLIMIWYEHYKFFRRYGFEDLWIITLNSALLFVVVLYIYPLKFMFSGVLAQLLDLGTPGAEIPLEWADAPALMTIYSTSIIAVFALIGLMYLHAYRQRERLGLDEAEILLTRQSLQAHADLDRDRADDDRGFSRWRAVLGADRGIQLCAAGAGPGGERHTGRETGRAAGRDARRGLRPAASGLRQNRLVTYGWLKPNLPRRQAVRHFAASLAAGRWPLAAAAASACFPFLSPHGHAPQGRSVRVPPSPENSGILGHRPAHARAWHRGQHRDLQRREYRAAPAVPVSGAGATRDRRPPLSVAEQSRGRRLGSRLPRPSRQDGDLRRRVRVDGVGARAHRHRQ